MGASIGTGDGKKSLNVELNIVPFIDLMSCLTAFLLVTAVWVNMADVRNQQAGKQASDTPAKDHPTIAILLDRDSIQVSQSPSGQGEEIAAGDWDKLEATLKSLRGIETDPQR